jgi:hypothetical protein
MNSVHNAALTDGASAGHSTACADRSDPGWSVSATSLLAPMWCGAGERGLFVGAENRSRSPLTSWWSDFKVNGHGATRAPDHWDPDSMTCQIPSRETFCIWSSVLNSVLVHDRPQDTPVSDGSTRDTFEGQDADQKDERIRLVLSIVQDGELRITWVALLPWRADVQQVAPRNHLLPCCVVMHPCWRSMTIG